MSEASAKVTPEKRIVGTSQLQHPTTVATTPSGGGGGDPEKKGWLLKWTNYIKGYQRRWFVLSKGVLSYYRNQAEINMTCRGTISLHGALIHTVDSYTFVISNGGTQTFHIKASNEVERQSWVTALELAKAKAIRTMEVEEDEEEKTIHVVPSQEISTVVHDLTERLENMRTCFDLITKHGVALQRALVDLETNDEEPVAARAKIVNERATLYRITSNAMINACNDYLRTAESQCHKWSKMLQHEREHRQRLEDMVEQLAKQHTQLEQAAHLVQHNKSTSPLSSICTGASGGGSVCSSGLGKSTLANAVSSSTAVTAITSDDENDNEFFDAEENNLFFDQDVFRRVRDEGENDDDDAEAEGEGEGEGEDGAYVEDEGATRSLNALKHNNSIVSVQSVHHQYVDANGGPTGSGSSYVMQLQKRQSSQEPEPNSSASETEEPQKRQQQSLEKQKSDIYNPTVQRISSTHSNLTVRSNKSNTSVHGMDNIDSTMQRSTNLSSSGLVKPLMQRRTRVPDKPNYPLNLWSIMKNCIGKELSKIPMPVNFNEPLSMLQRLTEDYEYADLLDEAAHCTDECEQLAYVAAFTISSYSTTANRTGKPFNPLLGETFECDRMDDLGWRCLAEQVSHHPPMAAIHCEGREWTCWQEFTMTSKFRGKYLQVIPLGSAYVQFNATGNKYTWRKVTTTVNNIIVGKLWVDQTGEMEITGLTAASGIKCVLKYIPYSYFSRETQRRVKGVIMNRQNEVKWVLRGTWDSKIEIAEVLETTGTTDAYKTNAYKTIWNRRMPPPDSERYHNFTELACQLNEMEAGVAPTDSRRRPDQRLMEDGRWDESNNEKLRLEEKQRRKRREREQEAEAALRMGRPYPPYEPIWFVRRKEEGTENVVHSYMGTYWEHKKKQEWSPCPDIF